MDMLANGAMPARVLPTGGEAALGAILALLLDELAYGALVTSIDGKLLHANHAARHELARRRTLFVRGDVLQACAPEGMRTLVDALALAAQGKRSLIEIAATQGQGITLAVLPLKSDALGSAARVALLLARASVCESLMLCFFARAHGLTAAEEHVLGILCQGLSAPQAARQLNVAVSTVRSHVRSLCAKTRCSGVREVVNQVAVLPPVAPAFRRGPMH